MKLFWTVLGVAFGIGLAFMIGQRMSSNAMAVVIGVVVGVFAAIPVSIIVIAITRRARPVWAADPPPIQPAQQPLIVMPQDLFKPRGPQIPPLTVGENFQLMPPVSQDARYAMTIPALPKKKDDT